MKMTVTLIVEFALRTVTECLKKIWKLEIRGTIKKNQDHINIKLEYLEESWRPVESSCHSTFNEKPPDKINEKKINRVKIITKTYTIKRYGDGFSAAVIDSFGENPLRASW